MLEPDSPWRRLVSLHAGAKVGAAAVIGSLALGGVAAAATGSVPEPLKQAVLALAGSSSTGSDDQTDEPSQDSSTPDSTDPSTAGTPTAGTPTAGTPTAGTPTAGTPTTGTPTTGTPTTTSWPPVYSPSQGPNPLGPAAWGLCHAFGNKSDSPSVAYQNVKDAATAAYDQGGMGDGSVKTFCAIVLQQHGVPPQWPLPDSTTTAPSSTNTTSGTSDTPSTTNTPSSPVTTTTSTPGHGHGHASEHGKAKGLNRG